MNLKQKRNQKHSRLRLGVVLSSFLFTITFTPRVIAFGKAGTDGLVGRSGNQGNSGRNIEMVATGQYELFDLSGQDGTKGEHGISGSEATMCDQFKEISSITIGARGGHGGQGGFGGDGGDGGKATIYYTKLDYLRRIFIYSPGGSGGPGGAGGFGGVGCTCPKSRWKLSNQDYYCSNGPRGNDGFDGAQGSEGAQGYVILVNQKLPLKPQQLSLSKPLNELIKKTHSLKKHVFLRRSGALQLFAKGSQVSDYYQHFDHTIEPKINVTWSSQQNIEDFADSIFEFKIEHKQGQKLYPIFVQCKGHYVDGVWTEQGNHEYTFIIHSMVPHSALKEIAFEKISYPKNGKVEMSLSTPHQEIEALIKTRFFLQFTPILGNPLKTQMHGFLSSNLVSYHNGEYHIKLFELPVMKHFKYNTFVNLSVIVERSYLSHKKNMIVFHKNIRLNLNQT